MAVTAIFATGCSSDFSNSTMDGYRYAESGGYSVAYLYGGEPQKPILLFLHGAPGSADNFSKLYENREVAENYTLISINRPGYGKSRPRKPLTSIAAQAEAAAAVLAAEQADGRSVIVVSWSYGSPIAAELQRLYPDLVDGQIFFGGSFDPENEHYYWFNGILDTRFFRTVLPSSLNSANREKMSHAEELRSLYPGWSGLRGPLYIIHGDEDTIVYRENSDFFHSLLQHQDEVFYEIVPEAGHMIPVRGDAEFLRALAWVEERLPPDKRRF